MFNGELFLTIPQKFKILRQNIQLLDKRSPDDVDFVFRPVITAITDALNYLRNCCTAGPEIQQYISLLPDFFNVLKPLLDEGIRIEEEHIAPIYQIAVHRSYPLAWQVLGNIGVQNPRVQIYVLDNFGKYIFESLEQKEISKCTDIKVMILYFAYLSGNLKQHEKKTFHILQKVWQKISKRIDENKISGIDMTFFHLFMEKYLIEYPDIVEEVKQLASIEERINFWKYCAYYMSHLSNEPKQENVTNVINVGLLKFASKQFQKKSEYLVQPVLENLEHIDPEEVLELLEFISMATGVEWCLQNGLKDDRSLFTSCTCLLKQINSIGKDSEPNAFTPKQKLEQVAPNSKDPETEEIEAQVTYHLKVMLVRMIANLLYRNKENQTFARDTGLISTILDSTTVDARNPFIKEWCILAIRNLCEDCPENQAIIANLKKVGDSKSDLLHEIDKQLGTLRISTKKTTKQTKSSKSKKSAKSKK